MPIIKVTATDRLRGKLLESDKWYSWVITQAKMAPTKDQSGMNVTFTFRLIETGSDDDGKEVDSVVNISSKGRSWPNALDPIYAASKNMLIKDLPKEGSEIDTDEMVGAKLDGKYKVDIYEGRPVGKIVDFLPYKAGVDGKAPW